MRSRTVSSVPAIVLAAVVVVIAATVAGGIWDAKGFVATCLVGSIVMGLVVTRGE